MPIAYSAGLVMSDGTHVLLGHTTHQWHWDLPKGKPEGDEQPHQACIRVVREETGMSVQVSDLVYLGRFKYNKKKDLELFLLRSDAPDLSQLRCDSFVTDRGYPELDKFEWVPFSQLEKYVVPNLHRVLNQVREKINLTPPQET